MNRKKQMKNTTPKSQISESKTYIDAENISAKRNKILIQKTHNCQATAYSLENDSRTKHWDNVVQKNMNISSKKLSGPRTKNKVDTAIMNDMIKDAKKGIKKQYLVTSDGDYTETVQKLKKQGVNVTILGEEKAPKKLRKAACRFIEI